MHRLIALLPALLTACALRPPACAPHAIWIAPDTLRPIADPLAGTVIPGIVLLGEEHDRVQDHRWELDSIERLARVEPSLVLGFEMFPRADQKVLDRWVDGGLSEDAFLAQADWQHVWGFDPDFYWPIFRFARNYHIPMLALNVSNHTIHLVAKSGFTGVPAAEREGVGVPAPPSQAYRAELAEVMGGHAGMAPTPGQLDHFIDAQLTWDRAMAEVIAAQHRPVVAIMGEGHLANRRGVPHQLDALGAARALVLLPGHDVCAALPAGYADAVFVE